MPQRQKNEDKNRDKFFYKKICLCKIRKLGADKCNKDKNRDKNREICLCEIFFSDFFTKTKPFVFVKKWKNKKYHRDKFFFLIVPDCQLKAFHNKNDIFFNSSCLELNNLFLNFNVTHFHFCSEKESQNFITSHIRLKICPKKYLIRILH